ncbi:MAG: GtrA family protein [Clostridia bacterium]|nr:GtrA family protein [Clostridia bacterium]
MSESKPSVSTESEAKKSLWQMVKFTLFSISAGLIQVGSFTLFNEVFHWEYWVSYLLALVLSVLWNFTFNRRYTFRSDANIPRSMALVALFYLVFTPLSTWAGDALTKGGANEYLVLGGTMVCNFVLEFLYQRYVVYRNTIDTNELARRRQGRE